MISKEFIFGISIVLGSIIFLFISMYFYIKMLEKRDEEYKNAKEIFKDIKAYAKEHQIKNWLKQRYHTVVRFIDEVTDIPMKIKCFIQRGQRGWSDRDWWNLDYYIPDIMIGMLTKLKNEGHSMPTWTEKKSENQAIKEWEYILNTITNTFKTASEISENDVKYIPLKDWDDNLYKRLRISTRKWNKECPDNKCRVLTKRQVREFEKGFDLFKEYFFSLWD